MTKRLQLANWLMAVSAASLAACSSDERERQRSDEPFGFVETRALASPLAAVGAAPNAGMQAVLLRDRPRVADEYDEALTRFFGIYGERFGPVRGRPEYQICKSAFREVKGWIVAAPRELHDEQIDAIWSTLGGCDVAARSWAGPAETATFGDDLGAMVTGSTMVLGYAAASAGSALGPRIYQSISTPVARRP